MIIFKKSVVYSYHWQGALNVINSLIVQMWSTSPSAIAGVRCIHLFLPWLTSNRSDLWGLTKLYQAWKKSRAWVCLLRILLQFMLLRTNLARELRIVRFIRSTYAVLIFPPESTPSKRITSSWSPYTICCITSMSRPFFLFLQTLAYFKLG